MTYRLIIIELETYTKTQLKKNTALMSIANVLLGVAI